MFLLLQNLVCETNDFAHKGLLTITNGVSAVAPAYGTNLQEHKDRCAYTVKDRGPRKDRKCAFPFRFDGKLYDGVCTNDKVCIHDVHGVKL